MKRYFITFLLVALCVTGVVLASPFVLAAPDGFLSDAGGDNPAPDCDPCIDADGNSLCDYCGLAVKSDPSCDGITCTTTDSDGDGICDNCSFPVGENFVPEVDVTTPTEGEKPVPGPGGSTSSNLGYEIDPDFVPGEPYSFTIEIFVGEDSTGDIYTLTGNPLSLRLGDLISHGIIFDGGDLGRCAFFVSYGVVALRTGIQPGGSYSGQFLLYNQKPFIYEGMYLISGHYEAVGLCASNDTHELVRGYYVAPTCTEEGAQGSQCAFCDYVYSKPVPALGHDFDLLGRCKREGCNAVAESASAVGGWFAGLGGWFSDVGDSIAQGAEDLWDKIKDAYDKGKDVVGDKVSSFAATVAVVAGLAIGIPVAILIGRFIKWLKKKK